MDLVRALLLVTLGLFAALITVLAVPGLLLWVIVLFVFTMTFSTIMVVVLAAWIALLFWRKSWISGLIMLAGFAFLYLAAAVPNPADSLAIRIVEFIHVVAYRRAVEDRLLQLDRRGVTPAVAVISIDGFVSAANGIAYDPTGEILLPIDRRSGAWKAVVAGTDLEFEVGVRHVVGNYYAWSHQ